MVAPINELDGIPHLRVIHNRVFLPKQRAGDSNGLKSNTQGLAIYLLSPNFQSSLEMMNTAQITKNNRVRKYYYQTLYQTNLFRRYIRINDISGRIERFNTIKKEVNEHVRGTLTRPESKDNMFIDLSKWNEIFVQQAYYSQTFMKKSETYIDCMKEWLGDPIADGYTQKLVLVDVRAWENAFHALGKTINITNPIVMMYFLMRKNFDKFKELGDVNIILVGSGSMIRINPSLCDSSTYTLLRTRLGQLYRGIDWDDSNIDEMITSSEKLDYMKSALSVNFNFTGDAVDGKKNEEKMVELVDKKAPEIIKEMDKAKKKTSDEKDELSEEALTQDALVVELSKELNTEIYKENKPNASTKRDEQLREKQKNIKLKDGRTIEEIRNTGATGAIAKLEAIDVSGVVATPNANMHKISFPSFDNMYDKGVYEGDMFDMMVALNKADIPMYIIGVESEDTSDEFNSKTTYTFKFEDSNRVRHSLTFDMPNFVEGKFLYLNGNKKMINKQQMMLPVVKIKEDLVQVATNYNKVMVTRYGSKLSPRTEKIRKTIEANKIPVSRGDNLVANKGFVTPIEYDEYSKYYTQVRLDTGIVLMFNQTNVHEAMKQYGIKDVDGQCVIGFRGKQPLYMDLNTHKVNLDGKNIDIAEIILQSKNPKVREVYNESKTGKQFLFTQVTIMAKKVPLILLAAYTIGFNETLRRAEIKYRFSDKRVQVEENEMIVPFADGFLIYDNTNIEHMLLMNGLASMPTKSMSIADLDKKEMYLDVFETMFNQRNIASAFDNFADFMIDPITKNILEYMDLPTEWVDVLLYANQLLTTNSYTPEGDTSLYRVRSGEILNVFLYKAITSAYGEYRRTANNNNPVKVSIRKDTVLKDALSAQTIEDYGILNPIVEVEKARVISTKGPNGLNLAQAYTMDKRAYHESMLGLIGMSTSPDAKVGVSRALTAQPLIENIRGFVKKDSHKDLDALKDVNLFTPAELASPLGASNDDSVRTAMAVKQAKHVVSVQNASPVLISNGMEQTMHHHLSSDFAVTAEEDGKVISANEDLGIMVVQYKSGVRKPIDISTRIMRNSAGGFYAENKLIPRFKVGQKFKQYEVLAAERKFFHESAHEGNKMNIGSLQKVAVIGGSFTYEDSTFITDKMSHDMSTEMIDGRSIVLSATDNISNLVKIGDKIKVGDELLSYESSSGSDLVGDLLKNIGDDLGEEVGSLTRRPITSKKSGEVVAIKFFTARDTSELSPSLQKLAKSVYNERKKKEDYLIGEDVYYTQSILQQMPKGKVNAPDGKIKGEMVDDGVLIQVFVKYMDIMGTADKLAHFTALKATVGKVIPKGFEPYTLGEPDEEISTAIGPAAIPARKTPSITITMGGNKMLVGLKKQVRDIYER